MAQHDDNSCQWIEGIVIPGAWDDEGRFIKLVICTPDEKEYFVLMNDKGKELLDFCSSLMKIKGLIKSDSEGQLVLKVLEFKRIKRFCSV